MDHRHKCKIQTIKLLEDSIEGNLNDLGYDNDLLETTLKAQSMKGTTDKLDFIKI